MMIAVWLFTLVFLSNTLFASRERTNAFESIKRLKECIDLIDKSGSRTVCKGKEGFERDACVERFTKKMMPTLNSCIERSRRQIRQHGRDEL